MDVRRVVAVKLLIDTHVLFWCLVGTPPTPPPPPPPPPPAPHRFFGCPQPGKAVTGRIAVGSGLHTRT
jgi:hypothetical protein